MARMASTLPPVRKPMLDASILALVYIALYLGLPLVLAGLELPPPSPSPPLLSAIIVGSCVAVVLAQTRGKAYLYFPLMIYVVSTSGNMLFTTTPVTSSLRIYTLSPPADIHRLQWYSAPLPGRQRQHGRARHTADGVEAAGYVRNTTWNVGRREGLRRRRRE